MNLQSLENTGVMLLRSPEVDAAEKTIVVVGVARGGTSIVAGSLHHLGVFMGKVCHEPVFEDLKLSLAFEGQGKHSFDQVISEYNREHELWGWKRPSSLEDLPRIAAKIRNPHFIFVFRDIFSIANRNAISMKLGVMDGLQKALADYTKIVEIISASQLPAMLVSSDKVITHKAGYLEALCAFSGITPTNEQRAQALAFVTPSPKQYLDKTRITKARGGINKAVLKTGLLRGWARAAYHVDPVQVEVLVDDKLLTTIMADIFRTELKKPNIHPTGECGYEVDLKALGVKPTSTIAVRVRGEVNDLTNSPVSFPHLEEWLISAAKV